MSQFGDFLNNFDFDLYYMFYILLYRNLKFLFVRIHYIFSFNSIYML